MRMKHLNKSCRRCFLVFSQTWAIPLDTFLRSSTQIPFSIAASSRCCCRRLQLGLQASLGNTSLTAVSLNDIQQRYLFFLNKMYLAPIQGSAFYLILLEFSWSCPLFLTACIHSAGLSSPQPNTDVSARSGLPFLSYHFA